MSKDQRGKIWIPPFQTQNLSCYTILQRRLPSTRGEHHRLHIFFYTSSVCACRGYMSKLFPLFWTNQRIKIEMLSNIKQTYPPIETEWLLWSCHPCIAVDREMPVALRGQSICMAYLGHELIPSHFLHAAQNKPKYLPCKDKPDTVNDVVFMSNAQFRLNSYEYLRGVS